MKPTFQILTRGFMVFSMITALAACKTTDEAAAPNGATSAPTSTDQHPDDEGGISAGGGGTLPVDPVAPFQVVEALQGSKRLVRMYINHKRQVESWMGRPDVESKYFFGPENLQTQLEKTSLEILEDRACKDGRDRDVDASVHASRPNTICFSVFRTAPKLIRETAHKEIAALLVHELSHFLGASEAEAVALQKSARFDLAKVNAEDARYLETKAWDTTLETESLFRYKDEILGSLQKADLPSAIQQVQELRTKLAKSKNGFPENPLSYLDNSGYSSLEYASMKLDLAWFYLSAAAGDSFAAGRYEECFGQDTERAANQLGHYCGIINEHNPLGKIIVRKLAAVAEVPAFLEEVFLFTHQLGEQVRAVAFDQPLPSFILPGQPIEMNPWSHFVGKYTAEELKCTSNTKDNFMRGYTHFEIYNQAVQLPWQKFEGIYVKLQKSNLTSVDAIYDDGTGLGLIKVAGDKNKAIATDERGTRWYDRQTHGWQQQTKSIERVGTELRLTLKSEGFWHNHNGLRETMSECSYKLTPL